jgi:hypothetical protein
LTKLRLAVAGLASFRESLWRPLAELVLISGLVALVAWVSGFFVTYHTSYGLSQYGLPLVWKTHGQVSGSPVVSSGLHPLGIATAPMSFTSYSWDVFAVDLLLYFGVFYLVVLLWRGSSVLFRGVLMLVSGAWLSVIALFFSWSSTYGTWTNGLPLPWMGSWYDGRFYNWIWLVMDTTIFVSFEYLALFKYRGFRIGQTNGPIPHDLPAKSVSEYS